ncbi:hypothetical protein LCGC14_2540440, partial [marine sediment metagenome]
MSNKLCPYCGNEPQPRGTRWVMCVTEDCPNRASAFTPEQWNKRFVCLDKNGDKVFAGDNIRLTAKEIGKDDDPFESVITLEPCISQDGVDMSLRYTETEATEAGIIMEIEL